MKNERNKEKSRRYIAQHDGVGGYPSCLPHELDAQEISSFDVESRETREEGEKEGDEWPVAVTELCWGNSG